MPLPSRNPGRIREWPVVVIGAGLAALVSACGDRTGLLLDPFGGESGFPSTSRPHSTSTSTSTTTSRFPSTSTLTSTSRVVTSSTRLGSTTVFTTTSGSAAGSLLFVSGGGWPSYAYSGPAGVGAGTVPPGPSLGFARTVCVTPTNPANCTSGSVVYGSPSTPWAVGNLLPNAQWIWRGDVADTQPADLQMVAFQSTYSVGPAASGSLSIGADDQAWVWLNTAFVGTLGSVTSYQVASQGQFNLTRFDLTPALQSTVPGGGKVTITVGAQNGPTSFGTNCPAQGCDYTQNPAGVIFSGQINW
jgi:hypothetical protein